MRTDVSRKVLACLTNFLRAISKPRKAYLLIYLVGLIWLVKIHFIREIASEYDQMIRHFRDPVDPKAVLGL